jgi:hypothetical protein
LQLRHFWYSRLEADRVLIARQRAIGPASLRLRITAGLFIPDRRGNNRIDGLKNILDDPRISLIFFVPGANETYRVNGRVQISADAYLRRRFAVNGKEPATVMVVTVEQAFQHCPKALMRSNLWKAGSGGRPQGVPTLGDFAAGRTPSIDSAALDEALKEQFPKELY